MFQQIDTTAAAAGDNTPLVLTWPARNGSDSSRSPLPIEICVGCTTLQNYNNNNVSGSGAGGAKATKTEGGTFEVRIDTYMTYVSALAQSLRKC